MGNLVCVSSIKTNKHKRKKKDLEISQLQSEQWRGIWPYVVVDALWAGENFLTKEVSSFQVNNLLSESIDSKLSLFPLYGGFSDYIIIYYTPVVLCLIVLISFHMQHGCPNVTRRQLGWKVAENRYVTSLLCIYSITFNVICWWVYQPLVAMGATR